MDYLTAAEAAKLSDQANEAEPNRELNQFERERIEVVLNMIKNPPHVLSRSILIGKETSISVPMRRTFLELGYKLRVDRYPTGDQIYLVWE